MSGDGGHPASTLSEWITTSEPGRIIARHPSLASFAPWLHHLWMHGDLEPTGPVPTYRNGVDEVTGIAVEYGTAPLPVIAPAEPEPSDIPASPVSNASATTQAPLSPRTTETTRSTRVNLLLEYLGVVQLCFFIPPSLRHFFSRLLLISGLFLAVQIPSISWSEGQFKKMDVFEALCREISTACQGVEARCDWLIFRDINPLRTRFFRDLRHTMENVTQRVADIPYYPYTQSNTYTQSHSRRHSRRLYSYDTHDALSAGGLILRQQQGGVGDGDYELGMVIWTTGELSERPSHTTLFHFPGSGPPPLGIIGNAPSGSPRVELRRLRDSVATAQSSLLERYGW